MKVTKRVTFDASHYLNVPTWTKEHNLEKFHKCSKFKPDGREAAHGHTYYLEVTVEGEVDPITGYVIDFKELKKLINDNVIEVLDHECINDNPYFKDKTATAENIIQFIWQQLVGSINNTPFRKLYELKLWETADSYATYKGE